MSAVGDSSEKLSQILTVIHYLIIYFSCVPPAVCEVAMPSADASVVCNSKPTPPKAGGPAPPASPAAVQSPPPKDESKKKKPEKKGNSWRESEKSVAHRSVSL